MSMIRWMAPVALMLVTAACAAAPAVPVAAVKTSAQAGVLDVNQVAKPGPYEKFFPVPVKAQRFPVAVIAHRGYSKVAPENTMAAFQAAIDAGADMLELDVHRTKDNRLVVMHDSSVSRTTNGRGDVEDLTLAEIKRLDAGGWFSPAFTGERVPTLDEVLALARGRINVMIELKDRKAPLLSPLVALAVERHQMSRDVLVSSFYYQPLETMKALMPTMAIGALVLPVQAPDRRAQAMQGSIAQAHHSRVGQREIDAAHAAGLRLHTWTVDSPETMTRLAKAGIDGLITNDVETCQRVLAEVFSQPAPLVPPVPSEPVEDPAMEPELPPKTR